MVNFASQVNGESKKGRKYSGKANINLVLGLYYLLVKCCEW